MDSHFGNRSLVTAEQVAVETYLAALTGRELTGCMQQSAQAEIKTIVVERETKRFVEMGIKMTAVELETKWIVVERETKRSAVQRETKRIAV